MIHPAFKEVEDVHEFQLKFDIPMPSHPAFPSQELLEFRIKFLEEELAEFKEAVDHRDMAKAADALVDLEYVLKGTVLIMGLGYAWSDLWRIVHRANMKKVRTYRVEDSKRGSEFDVTKPPGWVPPNIQRVLDFHSQEEDDS